MLFNSTVFLFWFLPISCLGFYLLAHFAGSTYAKVLLCVASFVFYGWWNPAFVLLLVGSIAFNFTLSLYVGGEDKGRRWLFAAGVAANLGLLFYYKYLFHILQFTHELGWTHVDYGAIILPIGISFFTFTQIGYLVDCREGLVRDRNLLDYVLFVTFFPHLIAGPILHHREIMPQFANASTYRFRFENIGVGLTLFSLGLIKKVLLADTVAAWAEAGFSYPQEIHGIPFINAWSTVLAYSMQLYFDFSGYSDMAIGIGIMFGIKLPLNFNSPYKSTSIIDFWQRWHMTLTRYLTLLLYNPVALWVARFRQTRGFAVNRQAASTPTGFAAMIVLPTVFTMFLAGIWHGAGLQFIVYGLLHAAYLTINHAWRIGHPPSPAGQQWSRGTAVSIVWRVILTYNAVLVAQIFFRANSAGDAVSVLAGMLGLHGSGLPLPVPPGTLQALGRIGNHLLDWHIAETGLRDAYNSLTRPMLVNSLLTLGLAAIAFGGPNVYQILNQWSPALTKIKLEPLPNWLRWRPNLTSAIGVGVLLFVATLYFDGTARFLYFQF